MKTVFLLWHTNYDEDLQGGEDSKLIGVYSSYEKANATKMRSEILPGFRDQKAGFEIVEYELDKDERNEGFATLTMGDYE
jgi:hypothetical protein